MSKIRAVHCFWLFAALRHRRNEELSSKIFVNKSLDQIRKDEIGLYPDITFCGLSLLDFSGDSNKTKQTNKRTFSFEEVKLVMAV